MTTATMQVAFDNDEQLLQKLYTYGESVAAKRNFTEDDVFEEIKKYRLNFVKSDS